MRLPAMLLLGIPTPAAAGTNIIVSAASALTAAIRHIADGRVDRRMVVVMGVPSLVGGFIGGFTSDRVPEALLITAVGALVAWEGVGFVGRAWKERTGASGASAASEGIDPPTFGGYRGLMEGALGLGVGLLGGAVGLILGSIRITALVRLFRVDVRVAAGTNLVIGFMVGSMGWIGHLTRGNVDYPLVVIMGVTAMIGSYLGAKQTGRVSVNSLVMTLGVVLVVVGLLLVWRGLRT